MRKIIAIAALLTLAIPSTVQAAVEVDGCSAILFHPEAQWVEIARVGDDYWATYETEDGNVDLRLDGIHHEQLAPGDYVATWDDGTVDTFTLSCGGSTPRPPDEDDTTGKQAERPRSRWLPETSTDPVVWRFCLP